jgi:hypothetical protein
MTSYGSFTSSALYRDAGCPSQCMSENDYAPLVGPVTCPAECMTNYANPYSQANCPSSCGFYEDYNTVGTMYKMYIPPSTASRIIPTPSVTQAFTVENPRIADFAGDIYSPQMAAVSQKIQQLITLASSLAGLVTMAANAQRVAAEQSAAAKAAAANQGPAAAAVANSTVKAAAESAANLAKQASDLAAQIDRVAADAAGAAQAAGNNALATQAAAVATKSKEQSAQVAQSAAAAQATAAGSAQETFRYLRAQTADQVTTKYY